jgi:glycosyltransferase involved in cell wall biosynthesis
MKILFVANVPSDCLWGVAPASGGERQLLGLLEALRAQGHDVELVNVFHEALPFDRLEDYDVVHIFGSAAPKGVLLTCVEAIQRFYMKPVFFTPVWWTKDEVILEAQRLSTEQTRVYVVDDIGDTYALAELCRRAFLLPSSHAEYEQIKRHLLLGDDRPYAVLRNAVDVRELEELTPTISVTADYVLCVGRIELRKNQHNLVRAVQLLRERGRQIGLVLLGAADEAYVKLWWEKETMGEFVQFLPHSSPPVVYALMKGCRVYAQPSFYETPGLASLEAAALGCPLVVGNLGAEREYFDDMAYYCDPRSPESITDALEQALTGGANPLLRATVREKYTYSQAAEDALAQYTQSLQEVI